MNYVRVKDIREELGITAKGLDKAIERYNIKKHFPYQKNIPYLLEEDAITLKKHIDTNGRVKAILEKDKKDFELEQEHLKLKEDYLKASSLIGELESKINISKEKIERLKNENELFLSQINSLEERERKLEDKLQKEKTESSKRLKVEDKKFKALNSRFREINLRYEEINKLYLLEKGKVETLLISLEENKKQLRLLETNKKDSISEIESVKEELYEVEKKLTSKEEDLVSVREQLEIEIKSKEVIEEEYSKFNNMSFRARLKFLFKGSKQ